MTAPKVPMGPGWWWRTTLEVVDVTQYEPGNLSMWYAGNECEEPVTDDGRWLCPVPSPEAIAAQAAEVEALRVEVGRLTHEVAALRATLGEHSGAEPIGCPIPGACACPSVKHVEVSNG